MTPFSSPDAALAAAFDAQFQEDGESILYQRRGHGEAYRISKTEHDCFAADYRKQARRIYWWMFAAMLVAVLVGIILNVDTESNRILTFETYVAIAIYTVVFVFLLRHAADAPTRALVRRTPVASALTKEARLQRKFSQINWAIFPLCLGIIAWQFWDHGPRQSFLVGWNAVWTIGAALAISGVAIQAWRKWRIHSRAVR